MLNGAENKRGEEIKKDISIAKGKETERASGHRTPLRTLDK